MESIGYFMVLALMAGAVSALVVRTKQSRRQEEKVGNIRSPAKFRAKRPLSDPEQVLFGRLKTALPDHVILSQVSFSQFLFTKGGDRKQNFARFAEVRQKVADFLVCDPSFRIVSVIELDDRSHRQEKDERRDAILKEAGLKIVRWKTSNIPNAETIRREILGKSPMNKKECTDDAPAMGYDTPAQE
ncbi:DUF2726 domain-containing protein [Nitrococcus mobilis]|uniref:DUF2726 domain-containing protein n=1 Tax=Nitrococcus mobilis Nb-231 TaxID=314278 RepID=A4BPG9_9GAMM|nr:DUF2726 domain-containing protein [Nitrococcus mobilis]EAR22470.1 hypothetical protein NB231_12059 [Nitrococcus mobilis Nb-231]